MILLRDTTGQMTAWFHVYQEGNKWQSPVNNINNPSGYTKVKERL
jgi:hypothetical protein